MGSSYTKEEEEEEGKMLTIRGVIVRRSCLGKKLSFCDIQCDQGDGSTTTANGGSSSNLSRLLFSEIRASGKIMMMIPVTLSP
jgi:hypothetical protein